MNRIVSAGTFVRQTTAGSVGAAMLVAGSDDVIDDDVIAPTAVVDAAAHAQVGGGGGGDGGKWRAGGGERVAGGGRGHVGAAGAMVALQRVAEVRVRIVLARQRHVTAAAGRQQLALLAVAPLHPPVLEPDLHLRPQTRATRTRHVLAVLSSF